jgi:hypothetical protein
MEIFPSSTSMVKQGFSATGNYNFVFDETAAQSQVCGRSSYLRHAFGYWAYLFPVKFLMFQFQTLHLFDDDLEPSH